MRDNSEIYIPGYQWYGNNRSLINLRARKGSGGTGILVKDTVYKNYSVKIIDKTIDGIIGIQLVDKISEYTVVIFSCYLPPDNSPYALNVNDFFAHLTSQSYLHCNVDILLICGDFNARVGNLKDTISCDEFVPERKVIDMCHSNQYGHAEVFVDFLIENKLCILNGRITPEYDNYTSVSVRGKAVVDYVISKQDCLELFKEFKVLTTTNLIDNFDIYHLITNNCKPPDHSILSTTVSYSQLLNTANPVNSNITNTRNTSLSCGKRYKFNKNVSADFQNNVHWYTAAGALTNAFINCTYNQQVSDTLYGELCKLLTTEMDSYLKSTNICKNSSTKVHENMPCKPYWNDSLKAFWNNMKLTERKFLQCRDVNVMALRNDFYTKRKTFMRELRKCERSYWYNEMEKLEHVCTNDPKMFWDTIKRLGPRKSVMIPEKVYVNGALTSDVNVVLQQWCNEFYSLYNVRDENIIYDVEFYDHVKDRLQYMEQNVDIVDHNDTLNLPISIQEVQYMIKNLKRNKAAGVDNIPYEAMMNNETIKILFNLYSKCFSESIIPSDWHKAIITPILKSSKNDPHVPTNYRAISLLSCICKGYTNILNNRLKSHYETNNLFANEQNGFRPKRSCCDHIFSITSIIRNRVYFKESTFACFIDFQKAFDFVDRDLLFYRLLLDNVNGKMYKAIRCIYNHTISAIRINGKLTKWFNIDYGVRQGDGLSTTLFSAFINSLALEINSLNCGINLDEFQISTLFYADDIVLLAGNERDLQVMIDCVDTWCKKWRMTVNVDKTNVVHFRHRNTNLTTSDFKIGNRQLKKVKEYKYLGIILDEFLSYSATVELLSGSANRALGAVINKFQNFKNSGYKIFTKLFHTNVCSILDYSSGIWGYKNFNACDKVQLRAQRWFLGVHNKTPILAITGDMGWDSTKHRRHINIFRYYNRILKMNDNRIAKKVFFWEKDKNNINWSNELLALLTKINYQNSFHNLSPIDIKSAEIIMRNIANQQWKIELHTKPKLRTYLRFKDTFETEKYVQFSKNRLERSLLAQIRSGTLPLNIELGRFRNIEIENRICTLCKNNVIEDEFHFIMLCPAYDDCRSTMFHNIMSPDFTNLSLDDKFIHLMKNESKLVGKFLKAAWEIRKCKLFTTN